MSDIGNGTAKGISRQQSKLWAYVIVLISLISFGVGCALARDAIGGDFTVFYVAGLTRQRLYDEAYVMSVRDQLPGAAGKLPYMPYLNPPFFALMMAPLAILPFGLALVLWRVFGLLVALLSFFLMGVMTGLKRWLSFFLVMIVSASSVWAMGLGQNSYLLLFIMVAGVYMLDTHRDTEAGLLLSLMLLKPHIAMLLPVAFVVMRRWRAAKAWLAGAFGLYVLSAVVSGPAWPLEYIRLVSTSACFPGDVFGKGRVCSLTGILAKTICSGMNPVFLGIGMTCLGAAAMLILLRFRVANERLMLHGVTGLAVALSIVTAPYMLAYDAILMAWPCMVLVSWVRESLLREAQAVSAISLLLILNLVGYLRGASWQPVVIVVVWVAILLWRGLAQAEHGEACGATPISCDD